MKSLGFRPLVVGMGLYAVLLAIAVVVLNVVKDPPMPVAITIALVPPLAAMAAILGQRKAIKASEGIERVVLTEATSMAFYLTTLTALAYGFLESWARAPHLSMLWVYFFGMAAWTVFSATMSRSYR